MNSNYIEYIHKLYNENKSKYDDFILNFHPTKLIVETGKEYTHGRDYSKVCSTICLNLIDPMKENS